MVTVTRVAKLGNVPLKSAQRTADALKRTRAEAITYALDVVSKLKPNEFWKTDVLAFDQGPVTVDIYGVQNEDGDWYVKFYVQHGQVVAISCHPPEWSFRRSDGVELQPWNT